MDLERNLSAYATARLQEVNPTHSLAALLRDPPKHPSRAPLRLCAVRRLTWQTTTGWISSHQRQGTGRERQASDCELRT